MHDWLLPLLGPRPPLEYLRDFVDVGLVAWALYNLMLLLRGTRAMQVGFGLVLIALVYAASQRLGLTTTYTLLDRFLGSFLILVVVIFQADIRRALMRVGHRPFFVRWRKAEDTGSIEEVVQAASLLAERHIGALIVFEREASLTDFVTQATPIDAELTRELLYTIFLPAYENPLHDGAVVLRNGRLALAGCFLPLTANATLERQLGTRHRAAIGISDETDAVVVVVSEERGEISLCFSGNFVRGLERDSLRKALYGIFYSKRRATALLREVNRIDVGRQSRLPGGSGSVVRASIPPPPSGRKPSHAVSESETETRSGGVETAKTPGQEARAKVTEVTEMQSQPVSTAREDTGP